MTRYVIHTADTAAEAARATLTTVEETVGFLPNVVAVLGSTPPVLDALVAVNTNFANGQLTPIEREIVQLAVSVQNKCSYCVAGHSAFAAELSMPPAEIAALRADRPLAMPQQEALRQFARKLAVGKGHGATDEYNAFLKAGYTAEQALEVILGVTAKMFTNTLAILLELPADDSFKPYAWSPEEANHSTAAA
ncbi:MAG: carboxymuconolactone decarboxylase family protein [Kiloniellaceae bacterium]